ncbi:hypothetical protein IPU70_01885 [Achromobacter sp. SD115]|uniref:hypothetical protein n=1 Tax=Achromobacter sp. SD115 TaxID=2782011 RepID=UPI001A972168|nr:hypothetical protein [Achromobacter sp. SD115]MBO1012283.1 hypothetical protein [Achromobacter sp. SD115]
MKSASLCIAAALATLVAVAALFGWAQVIARNDHRLFKADDEKRTRMLARSCGYRGQLWQDPLTRQFACLYVNPNGEALVQNIPDAPLLIVQR